MSRFLQCLKPQGAKAVLLSVKPRFADQIMAGTKRVEFRRSWTKQPVGLLLIYSSSPTQRLVGMVNVDGTITGSPTKVWTACIGRGPGLARKELLSYFEGKSEAHGILLGDVTKPPQPIAPKSVFKGFRAPQSFRYLSNAELRRVGKRFGLLEDAP